MIELLKKLFALFVEVARLFSNRTLINAGRAEKSNEDLQKVLDHEAQADRAVSVHDPDRDQRLRDRFDRSSGQ